MKIKVSLLILLIGLSVSVSAVEINKGWNLVVGGVASSLAEDNPDTTFTYFFNPETQSYIEFTLEQPFDLLELGYATALGLSPLRKERAFSTAWFTYTEQEETSKSHTPLPLNQNPLYQGWNFITISEEFIGKNLYEISRKGDCNVGGAYWWDYKIQDWESIPTGSITSYSFTKDMEGTGFAIYIPSGKTFDEVCYLISPTKQCLDTDEGINYFKPGMVIGSHDLPEGKDYCYSDTQLIEFYCKENGEIDMEGYECPNGCKEGACITDIISIP